MRKAEMEKPELILEVKLNRQHTLDLNVDLDINREEINTELSEQPSKFAWYATLYELAKAKVVDLKSRLETLESELNKEIREKALDGGRKITVDSVRAEVITSRKFKALTEVYNNALREQGLLMVAKQAFEQRKDMLISIASNMRNEFDLDLKVLKGKAAKRMEKV